MLSRSGILPSVFNYDSLSVFTLPEILGPSGIPAPRSESVIKAVLSGPFDAVDQADQFRRKVASVGNDFYGKFIQQIGTLHNA